MNIQQLLQITIEKKASDLHLNIGEIPTLRINGDLIRIEGFPALAKEDIDNLIFPLLNPYQRRVFEETWEFDFGVDFGLGQSPWVGKARFRANLYKEKGYFAAALRLIPNQIREVNELGFPDSVKKIPELKQGLVLVTGPTGHGKTTTLAAFINNINLNRSTHILTIEDPIEYIYPKGKALISQREINSDTKNWNNALKAALREDPDVVLIGEMRDYETVAAAMTIAETGHLVFATLHTNSASQTIDRIIDVFPVNQQSQIRVQLAAVLEAIISQRLVPTITPGRTLAAEILFGVPALRALIRDDNSHLIDNLIQTSGEYGMVTMETALATLVKEGKITAETAINFSPHPQLVSKLLGMFNR
ncbi:type IV pilus twitching motility protein PilT [Candidatus Daviesbacteria bacterium]|nr:type IV pilus twitching motility protein PilT [Candidatus Daviesbacteria bacterium]